MDEVYKRLAKKLDELPNGFPATDTGVELRILRKIFEPEDAEMALKLRPFPETTEAIAQRLGKPGDEMQAILDRMVERGQIGTTKIKDEQVYLLMPFVVGIFEFQLQRLDKELVDMVEEYAPALMPALGNHAPALMRVVPVNQQIEAKHEVQRYEDIRQSIEKAKSFQVTDCICRKERALQGTPCKHPIEVCLAFSAHEGAFDRYSKGKVITKAEALQVIAKAESEGLVHATYNVQSGQMFVCNCCSCCCGILRGMKRFNAPYLMAKSNYVAHINHDTCASCGACAEERCPMDAIVENSDGYVVQPERCIGCGVCASTCPTESITLLKRPENEQDVPPANIVDWYMQRAQNRGIPIKID
jgi:Na+-translocating ferredoxin:NAD+ oxidoreductase RNF subunit RnfB